MPTSHTPIYISYAWPEDGETAASPDHIVDRLYKSFRDEGYDVRRDCVDLGYKGLISEFMKEIGRVACVVTVINNRYLRSRFCMFELLEIYRNRRFHERICPIVLSDVRIYDLRDRGDYATVLEGNE